MDSKKGRAFKIKSVILSDWGNRGKHDIYSELHEFFFPQHVNNITGNLADRNFFVGEGRLKFCSLVRIICLRSVSQQFQ